METKPVRLGKQLGLLHVFCIASGAMISSGLFILPGLAHAQAGPAVVLSYLLGGVLATAGGLSIAELATAMPRAGGDYFFITRSVGPAVGTVAGMLSWFSLSLKSAFAILGMATFAALVGPVNGLLAGVILCAVFTLLNLVGVKEAARAQVVLVAGLFALLIFYVAVGLPQVNVRFFEPFAPRGLPAVFSTVGLVFVSFGGLLNISSVAEEVENPGRVIPAGLILSLVLVSCLYTLVVFVTSGVLGADLLDHSLTPISDGARAIMGRGGYFALSVGAMLAFISTANAGIMAASRYLFAISRDGYLPPALGKVGRRFTTPVAAIIVTGGMVTASLFLRLYVLVEAASTVLILTNILACLSVVILRESRIQNYRPAFRSPFYPWVQIAGVVGLGFVLLEMGEEAYLISTVLIFVGFSAYWFFGRKRASKESALVHLVERITARELAKGSLEDELKTIIRERDEIDMDRFDRAIEKSAVLDVGRRIDAEEFFALAADKLAGRVKIDSRRLRDLLWEREAESSTVIGRGLAVPHVILEGEGKFEVLLVRAREGIIFPSVAEPVNAVFVIAGTRDKRNLHLRALAAIAQIAMESRLQERWMAARGDQALRDIILLGRRRR